MGVNKVNYYGKTIIDISKDTVTANSLEKGKTAHNSSGDTIVGELVIPDLSKYVTVEEYNKLKSRIGRCGTFNT